MSSKEKEVYKIKCVHQEFYTGGSIKVSNDGCKLLCQCGPCIKILDVSSCKVETILGTDASEDKTADSIIAFELSQNNDKVVTSHKSGLLRLWNLHDGTLIKQWKSIHRGGVVKLCLTADSLTLATGGTDSSIRLWNLGHNSCTSNLLGAQGVFSALKFFEYGSNKWVFGAADDKVIRAWDIHSGKIKVTMSGHFSQVTAVDFEYAKGFTVSVGRDNVLIVWKTLTGENVRTVPLFEASEGLVVLPKLVSLPNKDDKLPKDGFYVATAGQKGQVRVWEVLSGRELYRQTNSLIDETKEGLAVTNLVYNEATSSLYITSSEHNIFVLSLGTFCIKKQFVGWPDEIASVAVVGLNDSHLAVATNSCRIALYCREDMSCQLLIGHKAFVLTLATCRAKPNLFASAGKDHSVRLWFLDEGTAVCVASATRHTADVLSIAMMTSSVQHFVSVSADTTLKIWNIPVKLEKMIESESLIVKQTIRAHEKDINSVTISPNDQIIATGSQDKTAKLWLISDLTCIGTLTGHRRGIWSVRFSPIDQVILTASADMTLRLWSLTDLSCLKMFEGHDASVLCGEFICHGLQIVSGASDGLIKLWSIKTSECVITLDAHDQKVWSLAVADKENTIYSGSCDSKLVEWEDWTEKAREERLLAEQKKALDDQKLANLVHTGSLYEAISLAIGLNRPNTLYKILFDFVKNSIDDNGVGSGKVEKSKLEDTILSLSESDKLALLNYAAHWNTNSKYCFIAQMVFSMLLAEVSTGKLKPEQKILEAIMPYTERHFTRLTQLFQDLHFIHYAKLRINPVSAVPDPDP